MPPKKTPGRPSSRQGHSATKSTSSAPSRPVLTTPSVQTPTITRVTRSRGPAAADPSDYTAIEGTIRRATRTPATAHRPAAAALPPPPPPPPPPSTSPIVVNLISDDDSDNEPPTRAIVGPASTKKLEPIHEENDLSPPIKPEPISDDDFSPPIKPESTSDDGLSHNVATIPSRRSNASIRMSPERSRTRDVIDPTTLSLRPDRSSSRPSAPDSAPAEIFSIPRQPPLHDTSIRTSRRLSDRDSAPGDPMRGRLAGHDINTTTWQRHHNSNAGARSPIRRPLASLTARDRSVSQQGHRPVNNQGSARSHSSHAGQALDGPIVDLDPGSDPDSSDSDVETQAFAPLHRHSFWEVFWRQVKVGFRYLRQLKAWVAVALAAMLLMIQLCSFDSICQSNGRSIILLQAFRAYFWSYTCLWIANFLTIAGVIDCFLGLGTAIDHIIFAILRPRQHRRQVALRWHSFERYEVFTERFTRRILVTLLSNLLEPVFVLILTFLIREFSKQSLLQGWSAPIQVVFASGIVHVGKWLWQASMVVRGSTRKVDLGTQRFLAGFLFPFLLMALVGTMVFNSIIAGDYGAARGYWNSDISLNVSLGKRLRLDTFLTQPAQSVATLMRQVTNEVVTEFVLPTGNP